MKNIFRTIVNALDSKPASAKGQSLVELAFTTPLLFLMIVSTAEIGFLANNYLVLLDAIREGARHATTLSPVTWNDLRDTRNYYRTACYDTQSGVFNLLPLQSPGLPAHGPSGAGYGTFGPADLGQVGFFDSTACSVIASMQPMQFNIASDDVVVSAIAYMNLCTAGPCNATGNAGVQIPTGTRKMVVTGRWPTSNRFCPGYDARDPFNYDGAETGPAQSNGWAQNVLGFPVTGNLNTTTGGGPCGSKFHVDGANDGFDLDRILNSLDNTGATTSILKSVPNGGMVIVEMTWQHHQLFGFPPLTFLGNPNLYVWQMFPVTAAEPTPTPVPHP